MPYTAHGEYHQRVQHPAWDGDPVATERDVDIVAEPRREGNVPSPPEVANAFRQIGGFEVVHEGEPHQAGASERYGGVAEEVAVNLHGVERHGSHDARAAEVSGRGVDRIDGGPDIVGDHDFQEEAVEHQAQTVRDVFVLERLLLVQLTQKVLGAFDGTRHQLWVEHDVQSIVAQVALGALAAAVDLDNVAQALEGVERQADGQRDVQYPLRVGPSEVLSQRHQVFAAEVQVFENEQHRAGAHHACQHTPPSMDGLVGPALHQQGGAVVDEDGHQKYQDILRDEPHVEEAAGGEEPHPAEAVGEKVEHRRHHR